MCQRSGTGKTGKMGTQAKSVGVNGWLKVSRLRRGGPGIGKRLVNRKQVKGKKNKAKIFQGDGNFGQRVVKKTGGWRFKTRATFLVHSEWERSKKNKRQQKTYKTQA